MVSNFQKTILIFLLVTIFSFSRVSAQTETKIKSVTKPGIEKSRAATESLVPNPPNFDQIMIETESFLTTGDYQRALQSAKDGIIIRAEHFLPYYFAASAL